LRVWPGAGRATAWIPAPSGSAGVFSPLFTGSDQITAVVSERVPHVRPEDEDLNDLFTYDLVTGHWVRRTHFTAHGDHWSAIRTPIVGSDGNVEFVRVVGDAAATETPASSLWRLSGTSVVKVRDLPREMYLAGVVGGRKVWNVFDPSVGDWRLKRENGHGGFSNLGCGRVMVDPLAEPDPDRGPVEPSGATPSS